MCKNIGILCRNIKDLYHLVNYPNNIYLIYYSNFSKINEIYNSIEFLISNNCNIIYIISENLICDLCNLKNKFNDVSFVFHKEDIISYGNNLRFILLNQTNKKIRTDLPFKFIDYKKINFTRKDIKPKATINKIKKILSSNNINVREKYIRKPLNGLFSIRVEIDNGKGANGKGVSLNFAKASAYAELMERLQSNMLIKKRKHTSKLARDPKDYIHLLNSSSKDYNNNFFKLDDIYFYEEKFLNIKTNKYKYLPINAINCFCHTNGLASGNSFEEAVT